MMNKVGHGYALEELHDFLLNALKFIAQPADILALAVFAFEETSIQGKTSLQAFKYFQDCNGLCGPGQTKTTGPPSGSPYDSGDGQRVHDFLQQVLWNVFTLCEGVDRNDVTLFDLRQIYQTTQSVICSSSDKLHGLNPFQTAFSATHPWG